MNTILNYIILLSCLMSFSQKTIRHDIELDDSIQSIWLDLNKVFNITITTNTTKTITLIAKSEGEYANHFVINKIQDNQQLYITGAIGFTFPNNQDKLSAHKVHAIDVELSIPEHLFYTVISDIGNLKLNGVYEKFVFNSESGNIYLNNPTGILEIVTIKGDITGQLNRGIINATSKNGGVDNDEIPYGISTYDLKTLKGNIKITKAQ